VLKICDTNLPLQNVDLSQVKRGMDLLSTTMIGAHSEDYKKCLSLYFEEIRKRRPKRIKIDRNVD